MLKEEKLKRKDNCIIETDGAAVAEEGGGENKLQKRALEEKPKRKDNGEIEIIETHGAAAGAEEGEKGCKMQI